MAIYLKKFETQAAYEAAESGLILPNVSLIADNNTVHYNPSTPTPPHDFVEIGGLKWATMNVGANSITDYGLYFQWGDAQGYTADQAGEGEGQKNFAWEDYKYATNVQGYDADMTKYNATDGKTVLEASDDAVTANWGGQWRMPTSAEYEALGEAVNTAWTANYQGSGVAGLVCTDKTDSSKVLFFPACGFCWYGVNNVDNVGYYWSSSLYSSEVQNARCLLFNDWLVYWQQTYGRYYGLPVRGVLNE